jgi:hypothetical protein
MNNILKLMLEFERRNKGDVSLIIHSDGSGAIQPFNVDEDLYSFNSMEELEDILTNETWKN